VKSDIDGRNLSKTNGLDAVCVGIGVLIKSIKEPFVSNLRFFAKRCLQGGGCFDSSGWVSSPSISSLPKLDYVSVVAPAVCKNDNCWA